MVEEVKKQAQDKMDKAVASLEEKLKTLRTSRPSPALFERIMVMQYGALVPLTQVASISLPEARLVVIQPWDKGLLLDIEKALRASDLGVNPSSDGNVIRLNFPSLSQERRQEVIKQAKAIVEEGRVALRNIRRDLNEVIKKAQKDSSLTEDQQKKALGDIQKMTDEFIKKIDFVFASKEKEVSQE